jgi:hypothetical protein
MYPKRRDAWILLCDARSEIPKDGEQYYQEYEAGQAHQHGYFLLGGHSPEGKDTGFSGLFI